MGAGLEAETTDRDKSHGRNRDLDRWYAGCLRAFPRQPLRQKAGHNGDLSGHQKPEDMSNCAFIFLTNDSEYRDGPE